MDNQSAVLKIATPWEKMLAAVVSGSSRMLGALLDSGISPDISESPNEVGLLTRALQSRFNQGALMLIEAGASVAARGPGLMPPLCSAARQRDDGVELCQALLNAGAPVDERDADGQTALFHATNNMNADVCRLLIEHGADAEAETKYGSTPLLVAATNSSPIAVEIMRLLVAAGASPSYLPPNAHPFDTLNLNAFQFAVAQRIPRNVAFFLHECDVDPRETTQDGKTMVELTDDPEVRELLFAALAERASAIGIESSDSDASPVSRTSKTPSPL